MSDTIAVSPTDLPHREFAAISHLVRYPKASPVTIDANTIPSRRALIVEFRDEVYCPLESMLAQHGWKAYRACLGGNVGYHIKHTCPDVLMVSEQMPDESGWLISCKAKIKNGSQRVWLYSTRLPPCEWTRISGVDEVFTYGGVVKGLSEQIQQRIKERWSNSGTPRSSTGDAYRLSQVVRADKRHIAE